MSADMAQNGYYEYYTDLINRPNIYGEEQLGYDFLGKNSKNLIKKLVLVNGATDTVFFSRFFYYFDDSERITSVAVYGSLEGSPLDSVQYFY